MKALLQNEHLWIYLSFFLFLIIFGKIIYKSIKLFLEEQIIYIQNSITNSKKPLEDSIEKLKNQKADLALLNKKISTIKQQDKATANVIIENFYENLTTNLQYIEETFKVYLNNEKYKNFNNLSNSLIDNSYNLTIKILHSHITKLQKDKLINDSIEKLDKILSSKS